MFLNNIICWLFNPFIFSQEIHMPMIYYVLKQIENLQIFYYNTNGLVAWQDGSYWLSIPNTI